MIVTFIGQSNCPLPSPYTRAQREAEGVVLIRVFIWCPLPLMVPWGSGIE